MICSCIYKHPAMKISRFDSEYLKPILTNIQERRKNMYVDGWFQCKSLKCRNKHQYIRVLCQYVTQFLCSLHLQPTRLTKNSKTLIDNILLDEHNTLLDEHAPIHKLSKKGYPLRRNLGSAEAFNHLWENATNFWSLIVRKQTLQLS